MSFYWYNYYNTAAAPLWRRDINYCDNPPSAVVRESRLSVNKWLIAGIVVVQKKKKKKKWGLHVRYTL